MNDENRTERVFQWIKGIINDYNAVNRIELYPIYQLIVRMIKHGKSTMQSEYKFDYEHYKITITLEKILNDQPAKAEKLKNEK